VSILTLTTDFGLKNSFVGTMKGVIWGICPQAQIADISHTIEPQNVLEGAYTLWRAYPFFPAGTVHVAVVDPGVGTARRPLAMRLGEHYFVGPDNGLFTPVIEDAEKKGWLREFVHLNNEKYWLPQVSHTFHGRDIFAPVGAHLAKGVPLSELGFPITDPLRLQMPKPEKTRDGWRAHITVVDVFGNCTTDLPAAALGSGDFARHPGRVSRSFAGTTKVVTTVTFRLRGREIHGLATSYGGHQPGEPIALVDSENFVEIAVVNGSAARQLGARVGDVVEVVVES